MLQFFQNYLREYGGISEQEVPGKSQEMLRETLPFVPVSHFFWGVWALLQFEVSPVGFGFADYARDRLGLYFKSRHLMDSLNPI
ncbi:unnamed protein product, partial [Mesorhabditis belari]|uniref:Uncharacterized protein n=1 Tax=Mesorhabditis belari TaxID=2138241 RepID=A0AAF3EIW6_9BILA